MDSNKTEEVENSSRHRVQDEVDCDLSQFDEGYLYKRALVRTGSDPKKKFTIDERQIIEALRDPWEELERGYKSLK